MKNEVLNDLCSIKDGTLEFKDAESFNLCLKEEPVYNRQGKVVYNWQNEVEKNIKLSIGNQKGVKRIVIPEGVETLPSGCLKDFKYLEEIVGPSVKELGDYSLCGCSNLKKAEFSPEYCSIGKRALYYCDNLEPLEYKFNVRNGQLIEYTGDGGDVVIPDGITSISEGAFEGHTNIKTVVIPDSVTSIGSRAFYYCYSLENITIPDSVTSIGYEAFFCCEGFKDITIPDSVKTIGGFAFHNCKNLENVTIGNGITEMGLQAFKGCKITNVNIKDLASWCNIDFRYQYNDITVESNPIYNEKNLYLNGELVTDLVIPDGVTEIKAYAFVGGEFESVTIPDSVTSIDYEAFRGCMNLETVEFKGEVEKLSRNILSFDRNIFPFNVKEIIVHSESMRDKLIETNNVPKGCEIKVVEKELDKEDELTDIGEIGGNIPTNAEVGKVCEGIMNSDEEPDYSEPDEPNQNNSKDER